MIPADKPEVDVNQFAPGATAGARPITVVPLDTPTLGDRSYLVHDGDVAFVIDPQRDARDAEPTLAPPSKHEAMLAVEGDCLLTVFWRRTCAAGALARQSKARCGATPASAGRARVSKHDGDPHGRPMRTRARCPAGPAGLKGVLHAG